MPLQRQKMPIIKVLLQDYKIKTMPLPRRAHTGHFETVDVNIYDIHTKEIVFTGGQSNAATFLNIQQGHLASALRQKSVVQKKYAIRIKSTKT